MVGKRGSGETKDTFQAGKKKLKKHDTMCLRGDPGELCRPTSTPFFFSFFFQESEGHRGRERSVPIGRRSSHLLWDESQFAELLITSTAESKPGEGEQLSAHLHITRPAPRGREGERRRYGDGGGRGRRRVGERWKGSDTKAREDGGSGGA